MIRSVPHSMRLLLLVGLLAVLSMSQCHLSSATRSRTLYQPPHIIPAGLLPQHLKEPLSKLVGPLSDEDNISLRVYARECDGQHSQTLVACQEFRKLHPKLAALIDEALQYGIRDEDSEEAEQGSDFEGDIILPEDLKRKLQPDQAQSTLLEVEANSADPADQLASNQAQNDEQVDQQTEPGNENENENENDEQDQDQDQDQDPEREAQAGHPEESDADRLGAENESENDNDGENQQENGIENQNENAIPAANSNAAEQREEIDQETERGESNDDQQQTSLVETAARGEVLPKDTWPNARVHYTIDSDMNIFSRMAFERAIRHWEDNTCVDFIQISDSNPTSDRVKAQDGEGCSSSVGHVGGTQKLTLNWQCGYGAAVHELGHAVGLYHEQSRQDRERYVKIHTDRIEPEKLHNFKKYNSGSDGLNYDYGSIMHYGKNAFRKNIFTGPTIEPKDKDAKIGQRSGLSDTDIRQINLLYKCQSCSRDSDCTAPGHSCVNKVCRPKRPIGEFCTKDGQCQSGHCTWFACAGCTKHSHCPSGRYCKNLANPFKPNYCTKAKQAGQSCLVNDQCASGKCFFFKCSECQADADCGPGNYCGGRKCKSKNPDGTLCLKDHVCQSGHCKLLKCRQCTSNSHCSGGKTCRNYKCQNKLRNGEWCTSSSHCASGKCKLLKCRECTSNSHCSGGKTCRNYKCQKKLRNGKWCTSSSHCASGKCKLFKCRECTSNSHCPGSQICSGWTCQSKASNGSWCISNSKCRSGHCALFKCRQCTSNSHCGGGRYCSGYRCHNKKGKGSWCSSDSKCRSGNCRWFKCR